MNQTLLLEKNIDEDIRMAVEMKVHGIVIKQVRPKQGIGGFTAKRLRD